MITVYWIVGMITVYWITGITTVYWLSGKIISWWKHFLTSTRNYFVRSRSCWDLSTILNTGVRRGDWLQGRTAIYRNQALWLGYSAGKIVVYCISAKITVCRITGMIIVYMTIRMVTVYWITGISTVYWLLGKIISSWKLSSTTTRNYFTRSGSCWDLSRILNVCVANWLQGRAALYRNQALWIFSWEDRSVLDLWADYC